MSLCQSTKSDLKYAHEDDLLELLTTIMDGQKPLYIFRAEDDEAFFASGQPITVGRICTEFPNDALYINGIVID